jgi:hypothetical protein
MPPVDAETEMPVEAVSDVTPVLFTVIEPLEVIGPPLTDIAVPPVRFTEVTVPVLAVAPVAIPSSLVAYVPVMYPLTPELAAAIEIAGVAPPEDTTGAVPVTEVTGAVPEEAAVNLP